MVIKLDTERLILRKPNLKDINTFEKENDVFAIKNFFMPYPSEKNGFEDLVKMCIKEWEIKKRYWFILQLKETGEVVGLSGIKDINNCNKTGYLSSWIFKKYRRKGYLIEAKIAINGFCFNELKLRKLKSKVATFNKPSLEIQDKFGMKFEGCLKKENFNPYLKKYADMNCYAIFKSDWKKILMKLKKDLKNRNNK